MNERFDVAESRMENRFGDIEIRIDKRFNSLNERSNGIDARLGVIERRAGKIENTLGDIQDDLTSALAATDNDGSAILNHEHRIAHLEKLSNIKIVPPRHLVGLE